MNEPAREIIAHSNLRTVNGMRSVIYRQIATNKYYVPVIANMMVGDGTEDYRLVQYLD